VGNRRKHANEQARIQAQKPFVAIAEGQMTLDDPADDRFLTGPQVRARYSVSDMWLHRRLHDDSGFPKPMIVNRIRFWKLSALVAWERTVAAREREHTSASPPKRRSRNAV
jgi:hypothetical protein